MLGERIRRARKNKKLTQEELAKLVNTKKTTISNYETNYSSPSPEMLSDLADVLDTSTDYLLGRIDNPNPLYHDGMEDIYQDEEFLKFANDPELQRWFKELPKSKEEDIRKLYKMWKIIQSEDD